MDELVKPADEITNYNTPYTLYIFLIIRYSGITEELLSDVDTTLKDI